MLPGRASFQPSCKRLVASMIVCLVLSAAATAYAQVGGSDPTGTGGRHSIKGRLVFPSGQRADVRLKVRLESFGSGDLSVFSDVNGNFGFQSLRPGNYTVVIEGGEYFESERETVLVEGASGSGRRASGILPISRPFVVQVYLRSKSNPTITKTGVLNAALAAVPKPAAEFYYKARESASKGDHQKATEQLRAALAIHSDFSLALSELGVQYLKLAQADKAAEALRAALKLVPDEIIPRLNYGIALLYLKKLDEAEKEMREVIKRNDSLPTAHMYLGIVLMSQKRLDQAEQELLKAVASNSNEVASAHRYLGGIYWGKRDYKKAADELETYLKLAPKAADAEKTQAAIKELRGKQ